jgi:uncharacterized membrane protein YkoI
MTRQFFLTAAALAVVNLAGAAAVAAPALPTSANSPRFAGHRLARAAHISLIEARTIALKARNGVITDEELEKEGGGSGLRYSFGIKGSGVTYEVGVDAKTGQVLENDREGAHPD